MAFFDRFKKVYMVKVRCYNCGHTQDCKVPKGMTIDSHLKTEAAQCENCGNPTLRRIELVRAPEGVRAPLREYVRASREPQLPILPELPPRRRDVPTRVPPRMPQRGPRFRPRPRPPQEYFDENQVDYPVDRPVPINEEEGRPGFNQQPEWTPKPKKINFWTGRE